MGRSCLLLSLAGKRVLLDCGVNPGRDDASVLPEFSLLGPAAELTAALDVVIISHFHLDHIGALPHLTEVLGYRGPIVMTHPTKAIAPMLLRDFRKVSADRQRRKAGGSAAAAAQQPLHTDAQVGECLARATGCAVPSATRHPPSAPSECAARACRVGLHETVHVAGLELTAYYAGHVLGAAMFHVRVGDQSVLYTGDFSTVADHHLRAAWVPRLQPNLLISEGTYATAPRAWKRGREYELLEAIRQVVASGGKVLIPVFAVGRAQELCLLLNTYWEQTGLGATVPIFFAAGMAEQATQYYRLFSQWTNLDLQQANYDSSSSGRDSQASGSSGNVFDFPHIGIFRKEEHWPRVTATDAKHPMVLFATPAMLSGGLALDVFKEWAVEKKNLLVMTGYCVPGTVGHAVVTGQRNGVQLGDGTTIDVKCAVRNISFRCAIIHTCCPATELTVLLCCSAHADADGLIGLIRQSDPQHVLLVHGEASKLRAFRRRVATELRLPCAAPPNGTVVTVDCSQSADVGDADKAPMIGRRKVSRTMGGRPQTSEAPPAVDLSAASGAAPAGAVAASPSASPNAPEDAAARPGSAACDLRWELDIVPSPKEPGGEVAKRRRVDGAGGVGEGQTAAAAVMAEITDVFRK